MWREVSESLLAAIHTHPAASAMAAGFEARVAAGEVTPSKAAQALIAAFRGEE